MSSKTLLRAIKFLIFVVIVGTPLFYIKQGVFPMILSKAVFFQSAVELLFFLWLALAISEKRFRPKRTPLLAALAVFAAVLILASALGVDPWRSFWSIYERAFGVFTILHLAAFALVISSLGSELPWKKIFYASLVTSVLVDIIAIIQLWNPYLLLNADEGGRPGATFGNPTFLAGYVLWSIFICLYLISLDGRLTREDRRIKWITVFLFAALALETATLFITQSRGDILGFFAGLFILFCLFILHPPQIAVGILRKKSFYAAVVVLLIVSGAAFWFTRFAPFWDNIPGLARFRNVGLGSIELQPRLIALRAAWLGFLEKPVLGWGWDNFNVPFNKHYDPRALETDYLETRFDKPHNFFLEYLIAGGILLTLSFIALIACFVFALWRMRNKFAAQIFIAALAAFIVQNLFIFDTLGPALLFYLVLGFADCEYKEEIGGAESAAGSRSSSHPIRLPGWLICGAAAIAAAFIYQINYLTTLASYYEWKGFNNFSHSDIRAGIDNFKTTLSIWSPYRWNFARDYASEVSAEYFYNPGNVRVEDAQDAIREMEKVRDEHSLDAYNHYALIDFYDQISAVDPQTYLPKAEHEAEIALRLSPDRQQIYISLAKTKSLEGDNAAALALVRKALDLDPKVPDAHFFYGVLLFATGNPADGYREVRKAMELGRQWRDHFEPRVVADYFGDAGHLDEAINLYNVALGMDPGDLEARTKLGVAYFLAGDPGKAKESLNEVGRKFDFRKSPAFSELKPILDRLGVTY